MARRKTAARRSGNRQPEAIAMLIADHQKVRKLFRQFEKTEDAAQRGEIAEEACNDLTVHAQLEEQVFYPAIRKAIEETDLVAEAEVEHAVAKELIEKLKGGQAADEEFAATFTVLAEYVGHHIEEEEGELFPKVRKADLEFEELAREMLEKKQELRADLGLPPEEESKGSRKAAGAHARSASR
jgi:hemerythrin-like domain-containing protein